jgi:hypothetical protein
MPKISDAFLTRGSIIKLMAAALQRELIKRADFSITLETREAIMAKVLERAGTAAHSSNEQAHESQRPDR